MITKGFFGSFDGSDVEIFTIKNKSGAYVELIGYGAAIRSICAPDKSGNLVDVCLGYDTLEEYTSQTGCLGAVIGRHANRLGGAEFTLGDVVYKLEANNGPNNLHGGSKGFHTRVFKGEIVGDVSMSDLEDQEMDLMTYIKNAYSYKADRIIKALSNMTDED